MRNTTLNEVIAVKQLQTLSLQFDKKTGTNKK
jgi:hypothetical protein